MNNRKTLLFLSVLLLHLSAMGLHAEQLERKREWKPVKKTAVSTSRSVQSQDTLNYLADGIDILNKTKASRKMREAEASRARILEQLENPAIDLYGADTWNENVNPFVRHAANIPAHYDIDCSGFVMPLDGNVRVTSNYGYRHTFRRNHYGIDLALRTGDTIRAAFDGKVRVRSYEGKGYGHYVVIRHPNGLETVYGHMSRVLAHPNKIVKAGDPIGLGGSTGRSTGPHLHFETRFLGQPINPSLIFDFVVGAPLRDFYSYHNPKGNKAFNGSSLSIGQLTDDDLLASNKGYVAPKSKASAKKSAKVYRIRKGDTLSAIADRNGTTIAALCKANGISRKAKLTPGKVLKLAK